LRQWGRSEGVLLDHRRRPDNVAAFGHRTRASAEVDAPKVSDRCGKQFGSARRTRAGAALLMATQPTVV
jgi:hypothetical protein